MRGGVRGGHPYTVSIPVSDSRSAKSTHSAELLNTQGFATLRMLQDHQIVAPAIISLCRACYLTIRLSPPIAASQLQGAILHEEHGEGVITSRLLLAGGAPLRT